MTTIIEVYITINGKHGIWIESFNGKFDEYGMKKIRSMVPEKYHNQIDNVLEHQTFDENNKSLNFDIDGTV